MGLLVHTNTQSVYSAHIEIICAPTKLPTVSFDTTDTYFWWEIESKVLFILFPQMTESAFFWTTDNSITFGMKWPIALYGLVDQDSTLLSVETNHFSSVNKFVINYFIQDKRDLKLFLAFTQNKGKRTFECLHTTYQHIIGAEERHQYHGHLPILWTLIFFFLYNSKLQGISTQALSTSAEWFAQEPFCTSASPGYLMLFSQMKPHISILIVCLSNANEKSNIGRNAHSA